jgi:hypothetical protein
VVGVCGRRDKGGEGREEGGRRKREGGEKERRSEGGTKRRKRQGKKGRQEGGRWEGSWEGKEVGKDDKHVLTFFLDFEQASLSTVDTSIEAAEHVAYSISSEFSSPSSAPAPQADDDLPHLPWPDPLPHVIDEAMGKNKRGWLAKEKQWKMGYKKLIRYTFDWSFLEHSKYKAKVSGRESLEEGGEERGKEGGEERG